MVGEHDHGGDDMIEIELRNIMQMLAVNGEDLRPFCEKLIYTIQKQHGALAGVRINEDARAAALKCAEDLTTLIVEAKKKVDTPPA